MKRPNWDTLTEVSALVCLVTFFFGVIIGLVLHSHINLDSKLTLDGLVSGLIALLALLVATIVLPMKIQPLIDGKHARVNIAQSDIGELIILIKQVIQMCDELHATKKVVTNKNRQAILSRYKQIHNMANILAKKSDVFPELTQFSEKIKKPLDDSHNDFADIVVPGKKLSDGMFLEVRSKLDPITYELYELRYKIN